MGKIFKIIIRYIFIVLFCLKSSALFVFAIFHPKSWRSHPIGISSNLSIREDGALVIKDSQSSEIIADYWSFQPLSYIQLLSHLENMKDSKITLKSLKLQSSSGYLFDQIETVVDYSNSKIYAITLGGWLPPFFALRNANVLVDRNVFGRFEKHFKNKLEGQYEWIDVLNNLSPKIDILWYGLEANNRQHPTPKEIDAQLKEAYLKARKELPGLSFVRYGISHREYIETIIEKISISVKRRQEFLKIVSEHLKSSSKIEIIKDRWTKILKAAVDCKLGKNDICVLLAMICVSAPQEESPGIGLIKPDNNYDDKKAYNAALDIQLMELFVNKQKVAFDSGQDANYVILTSDKDLAKLGAFLSGLNSMSSNGHEVSLSVTMPKEIFGRNCDQLQSLYNQLMGLDQQ